MDHTLALIMKSQQGDKEARDTVFKENAGLVYSMAKRFAGRSVEMEDIVQIGSIGLLKAIDRFDISYDVKFSTYAVPMIIGEIRRYLRDDGMLKVSRNLKENCARIYSAREALEKELGREPILEEVAKATELSVDEVVMSMESGAEVESLHKIIYQGDGNDISLMDRLQEKENGQDAALNRIFLDEILKKLDARERQLIGMRYFKDMTQTEIAAEMGISQVQVSRTLGYGGILIFIDVVGVFVVFPRQIAVLACAFQLLVQLRILSGNIQLAVSVNGQHQPGGAFHKVISAHVQVGKSQLAVLDGGRCHKPVFLENRQIVGIPAAVGKDGGVPDGSAIGICNFRIIHDAGNAVRVFNGIRCVQVVHCPLKRGITVATHCQIPRGVQVHFRQQDIAKDAVILHLVGVGVHGVGIFVVGDSGGICGVGLICGSVSKGDSNDALAGVDERAAAVGRGDVGVIIGVAQPNRLGVQ